MHAYIHPFIRNTYYNMPSIWCRTKCIHTCHPHIRKDWSDAVRDVLRMRSEWSECPGLKQFHCPGPRWSRSDVLEASDRDPGGTDRRKRHGTAEFTAILRKTRQGDRGIVMQRVDEQLRFTKWSEMKRLFGSRGLAISQPPYDDLSKDDTIWGLKWFKMVVLACTHNIYCTYAYKYAVYIYMIVYVLAPKSWYICRDGSSCEWNYLRKVETRWPSPGRR